MDGAHQAFDDCRKQFVVTITYPQNAQPILEVSCTPREEGVNLSRGGAIWVSKPKIVEPDHCHGFL